ncbi:MAG: DUF4157 domain-containing protein [Oscillospiraceae bacterium]|nr:DUF4157 domain-containing protein [Oscillospiraceae bacterium]
MYAYKHKNENKTVQRKVSPYESRSGIPAQMKENAENQSGVSFDDVKVHYNSSKPTQLQAHAYTQGSDVHIAPGQEKHLGHELGHVVQQKQGRVQPTMQLQGVGVNDDELLEGEADEFGEGIVQNMADEELQEEEEEPLQMMAEGGVVQRGVWDKITGVLGSDAFGGGLGALGIGAAALGYLDSKGERRRDKSEERIKEVEDFADQAEEAADEVETSDTRTDAYVAAQKSVRLAKRAARAQGATQYANNWLTKKMTPGAGSDNDEDVQKSNEAKQRAAEAGWRGAYRYNEMHMGTGEADRHEDDRRVKPIKGNENVENSVLIRQSLTGAIESLRAVVGILSAERNSFSQENNKWYMLESTITERETKNAQKGIAVNAAITAQTAAQVARINMNLTAREGWQAAGDAWTAAEAAWSRVEDSNEAKKEGLQKATDSKNRTTTAGASYGHGGLNADSAETVIQVDNAEKGKSKSMYSYDGKAIIEADAGDNIDAKKIHSPAKPAKDAGIGADKSRPIYQQQVLPAVQADAVVGGVDGNQQPQ